MAFPEIITTLPVGTQLVSTIDDFERETRTWLKQCMQEISGYPDVNTVAVKGWTDSTRPTSNPNSNYLLGYNTQTGSLEVVDSTGSVVQNINNKSIALLAHPVGEYYWTSNASFNPNNEWGGTWERIQDGRVLISNNSSHSVGSTGGAETVTLTVNQIASHSHPHTHKHKHNRGTMNITGRIGNVDNNSASSTGAFYRSGTSGKLENNKGEADPNVYFDASRNWSGYTSEDATAASSHAAGGGQAHNNMQPYRTAICWHRTA